MTLMPTIHRLDNTTINQIAAGEVIENSASIIKELIENALDAKASEIAVEIKAGGRNLIRVTDNGIGMGEEDAILAFERHATSKLKEIEDLEKLHTMGFRGEALAAIASISHIRLLTRQASGDLGTLVEIRGGTLLTGSQVPCQIGTLLEVKDLFYNAPARKKFLKSPAQEIQEIQKNIISISLGHPEVGFSLISDGVLLLNTFHKRNSFIENLSERAMEVLPKEIGCSLQPILHKEEGIELKGVIAPPTLHRQNRSGQYLFINRRLIQSWIVSQAVSEGYGSAIPERRFPFFILHLDIPPSEIDVNVHPQKKEVRFRQETAVKKSVRNGISKTFGVLPLEPIFQKSNFSMTYKAPELPVKHLKEETQISFSIPERQTLPKILGTFFHFLILEKSPIKEEKEKGICLFDCKKAQERITYESFIQRLHQKKGKVRQTLLIPLEWSPPHHFLEIIELYLPRLETWGFSLRRFTKKTWLIEAIPSEIGEIEAKSLLETLLDCEDFFTLSDLGVKEQQKLALLASSHLKKMDRVEISFGEFLLSQLLACQYPYFSPKGESIFAWIPLEDLAKYFRGRHES